MLRRLLGEDIELVLDMRARGQVEADPGQIEQVIMNLVINARDAMPEGGSITISTHEVEPSAPLVVEPPVAAKGPMTCLTVADTGSGMDEATRAQIFEPFFTTKGAGQGDRARPGDRVRRSSQQSGGTRSASTARRGSSTFKVTTFRISRRRATRPLAGGGVPGARGAAARGGTETVLLVEDEAPLAGPARDRPAATRRTTVLEAPDGVDALALAARCPATDRPPPHRRGDAAHERPSSSSEQLSPLARPDIKVLFMSGYTDDAVVRQRDPRASHVAFLQKPLTPATLLSKVRETLETAD